MDSSVSLSLPNWIADISGGEISVTGSPHWVYKSTDGTYSIIRFGLKGVPKPPHEYRFSLKVMRGNLCAYHRDWSGPIIYWRHGR